MDTRITSPAIDQVRAKHGEPLAGVLQTIWNALVSRRASESRQSLAQLSLPRMTAGSVLFIGADGVVTEDNTHLFWSDAGDTLGVQKLVVIPGSPSSTYAYVGGVIKEFYADGATSGTGEDTLYTYDIQGNVLDTDGQKIGASFAGVIANAGVTTARIKLKFAGTTVFDTGALAFVNGASWSLHLRMIRESSSVVRCSVDFESSSTAVLAATTTYTRITGLTLSGDNTLLLTGEVSAAGSGEAVTAKMGSIRWDPASA